MIDLTQKVAVVTGAASGIGLALARQFAAEGMRLVLADIEQEPLDRVAGELRGQGVDVLARIVDVSDGEAVEALARDAYGRHGKVHVVCNNAGIVPGGRYRPIWEFTVQDWHWAMGVNLMGVVHGIRSFVPRMRDGGDWGHVVNTISVAGLFGGSAHPVYGASKHAAMRATEALHASLSEENSPIGVTALCPGVVRTNIGESERNRPTALAKPGGGARDSEAVSKAAAAVTAAGLDPAAVARMVVRAIHDRTFYLLTTTAFDGAVRARMEDILERRNPRPVDLMGMAREEVNAGS